jgi:hypothetical protein
MHTCDLSSRAPALQFEFLKPKDQTAEKEENMFLHKIGKPRVREYAEQRVVEVAAIRHLEISWRSNHR